MINIGWSEVIQVAIGSLIAILFVIFVEYLRKPRFRLKIDKPTFAKWEDRPARTGTTLGLLVENRKLPRLARWMSRNAAVRCYGYITFLHLDGQEVFNRAMPIKWSREPGIKRFPNGRVEAYTPDLVRYINIHPGEEEIMDVAVRYDDDDECYGWTYDNYFSDPPWRNPEWKLKNQRYLIKIEIISAGDHCYGLFRLNNDGPVSAFRLAKALPDDVKKVFGEPKISLT